MKAKKTWREKMIGPQDLPRVVILTPEMSKKWGTGKMVIPAPMEVEEIMKKVPRGKVITINGIRSLMVLALMDKFRFSFPSGKPIGRESLKVNGFTPSMGNKNLF